MEALISDSDEFSQLCAQSLTARGKDSAARIWSAKLKRDSWMQLLFGRTLRPSHGSSFVDAWTSFQADTLASRSQPPASASAPKTQDTSGRTSAQELTLFDLESVSSRTSKDTLPSGCVTFCATWASWVTERRLAFSQRLKSARRTSESGSLSWPTANARDWKDGSADCNQRAIDAGHQVTLARAATCWSTPSTMAGAMYPESNAAKRNSPSLASQVVMWPTPTTAEAGKISNQANFGQMGLSNHPEIVGIPTRPRMNKSGRVAQASDNKDGSRQESWATPQAHDAQGPKTLEQIAVMRAKGHGVKNLNEQCNGKLNPRWVETLMGLPIGWTMPSCTSPQTIAPMSCDSSATASCLPPQSGLSEFSLASWPSPRAGESQQTEELSRLWVENGFKQPKTRGGKARANGSTFDVTLETAARGVAAMEKKQ
jgi:hypothetical protein